VLVSVWKIEDRATAGLMGRFYTHLQGRGAGQALRAAQLEMLAGPYSHPFFWAPFVLYGP